MSRPRKSVAELIQSGTYRPSRHLERLQAESAANGPIVIIERPAILREEAVEIFERKLVEFRSRLAPSDATALGEWANCEFELMRQRAHVATIEPGDKERLKALRALASLSAEWCSFNTRFGGTPRDRQKLGVASNQPSGPARVPSRPRTVLDRTPPEEWNKLGAEERRALAETPAETPLEA